MREHNGKCDGMSSLAGKYGWSICCTSLSAPKVAVNTGFTLTSNNMRYLCIRISCVLTEFRNWKVWMCNMDLFK